MSLSINNLKPNPKASRNKKRVGRGNSSGHGTTGARGTKGQKSRSGASGLIRLGLKKMLLSVPKQRGFKSLNLDNQVLNLDDLNVFKEGDMISLGTLMKKGILRDKYAPVKLLGEGQLNVKNLKFKGILISRLAKEQIEKNGGEII